MITNKFPLLLSHQGRCCKYSYIKRQDGGDFIGPCVLSLYAEGQTAPLMLDWIQGFTIETREYTPEII
jgi:hypothetical protein